MTPRCPLYSRSVTLAVVLAGALIASCTTVDTAPAGTDATPGRAQPDARVLQGSVLYRERVPLPQHAEVRVQLVDVASTPARTLTVLAETTFATAGRQVPVPFELRLDPTKLEPGRSYGLRAYILVDGKVSYVTATRVNVDPQAPPVSVSILLMPGSSDPVVVDSPPPPGSMRPPAAPSRSTLPRGSGRK